MRFLVALLLCGLCGAAFALEKGERLAPWTLLDQFDQPYTLDEQARVLLVARNMKAATLLEQAIQDLPKGALEQRQVVFLVDISRMPGPVSTLFAIPAMRHYDYRVILDRQARVAPRYPAEADALLWIDLDKLGVVATHSYTDAAALSHALTQAGQ